MNPSGEMEGDRDSPVKSMGNKGFTLIETIIVIVLAGILLPALVAPFLTGVKQSGKPEMVTTAMYLAQQKMEELMKFDYMDASLDSIALTPYANTDIA
ncbi:MAG: type II secretion system protein, partial [Desulfatiglandales bacterium]